MAVRTARLGASASNRTAKTVRRRFTKALRLSDSAAAIVRPRPSLLSRLGVFRFTTLRHVSRVSNVRRG